MRVEYHSQLASGYPGVDALAGAMDPTAASIWMRKGNFDSLDPLVRGLGLSKASKLTV